MTQDVNMMLAVTHLRGELDDSELEEILAIDPEWNNKINKIKLNMKLNRKKLLKKATDAYRSGLHKARHCKRYRPGKQNSTQRKETKVLRALERQFFKLGLAILGTWDEFLDDAEKCLSG